MDSCYTLASLSANCDSTKKVGGVTAKVWIGEKNKFINGGSDNSIIFDNSYTTDNVWYLNITNVSEIVGDELSFYEGVRLKNSGGFEVVAGENVNTFTQNLNLVLFHYTQAELKKLEQLILNQNMIAFVLTEAGQVKCFGIDKLLNNTIRDTNGLQAISGTGADIVELQGEVGVQIQLQATLLNIPVIIDGYYEGSEGVYFNDLSLLVDLLNLLSANNA